MPELGVDRVVAAGRVADRPRRARDRPAPAVSALFAALAVGQPDRVDRRQVDDVEAELGEPRELLARRPPARPTSAGTAHTRRRSGPGARSTSIASGLVQRPRPWRSWARSTAANSSGPSATSCLAVSGIVGVLERRRARARSARGRRWRVARSARVAQQQRRPRTARRRGRLAGGDLALELVAPGPEHVGPRLDRVLPAPERSTSKLARPADAVEVGVDPLQLGLAPAALARARGSGRPPAAGRGRRGRCRPRP